MQGTYNIKKTRIKRLSVRNYSNVGTSERFNNRTCDLTLFYPTEVFNPLRWRSGDLWLFAQRLCSPFKYAVKNSVLSMFLRQTNLTT